MVTSHHECNAREALPLSYSMFYNQSSAHEPNNPNYSNHVQENINLQQNQQEINQQYSYYSALRNHHVMLEGSKQNQASDGCLQLSNMVKDEVPGIKNWDSSNFTASHAHEAKMSVLVEDNRGESGSIGSMTFGDIQSLSLSMSPSSQSSSVTTSQQTSPAVIDSVAMSTKKRGLEMVDQNQKQIVHRKSIDTFGQRTSQYRGVTRFVPHWFLLNFIGAFVM